MIEAIYFDFGNVIGFFDHGRTAERLAHFSPFSPQELLKRVYAGVSEERYERGELTTEAFFEQIKEVGQLTCSLNEFIPAFQDIFWPNETVIRVIDQLHKRGHRLFLASNTNQAHYDFFRVMFADTLSKFEALAVSHEAKARKPEARFFDYAQRLSGVPNQACLFIDDLATNIAGAQACGWKALHYTSAEQLISDLSFLNIS